MALRYESPKMTFKTSRNDVSVIAVFLKENHVVSTSSILYFNNQTVANAGYSYTHESDHVCINLDGAYQSGYQDILIFTYHDDRTTDESTVLKLIKNAVDDKEIDSATGLSMKTIKPEFKSLSLDYHLSLEPHYRKARISLLQTPCWFFSQKNSTYENSLETLNSILNNSFNYEAIGLK